MYAGIVPQDDPARCGLAWAAKVVCSGVYITGRASAEVLRSSCIWMTVPDAVMRQVLTTGDVRPIFAEPVEIIEHPDLQAITLRKHGIEAHARFFADQGAVIVAAPDAMPQFTPQALPDFAPPPAAPWPLGEQVSAEPSLSTARQAHLDAALNTVFRQPNQFTNAFLVVHNGRLIAERYANGFGPDSRFEAWSMGKSLAATLVGLLHQRGELQLDDADLFTAWGSAADPRRAIRVRDLLNMASGLAFTGSYGSEEDTSVKERAGRWLDHIYVYAGGVDSVAFCLDKPLEAAPGTLGRYRNCDPLLATALVRERSGVDPAAFLRWPHEQLFTPLGMRGMVLEPDPYGQFLISGHTYGRARDWARLGLLYLQRGAWAGRQLLAEPFVDFVQTPNAAWAHPAAYGGFFVTNRTGNIAALPPDAYWMAGGGRQHVFIVPSLNLVVMRMGHMAGQLFGLRETLEAALGLVVEAVQAS
jgi:CubicO group peptidase (beta-lactamase class C family)